MSRGRHSSFPVFSKSDLQQAYDQMAPNYRRSSYLNNNILGANHLREWLFQTASGKILDVACGTGENFPYYDPRSEITAVDLSPSMLARARSQAETLDVNVQLQMTDAEALPFADDAFDAVTSALSTCTFPNPIVALNEMARVCRPEGRILLLEHGRSRVAFIGDYQDRMAVKHYQVHAGCRWNQEPRAIVEQAGLQIISTRTRFFGIFRAIEASPSLPNTHFNRPEKAGSAPGRSREGAGKGA